MFSSGLYNFYFAINTPYASFFYLYPHLGAKKRLVLRGKLMISRLWVDGITSVSLWDYDCKPTFSYRDICLLVPCNQLRHTVQPACPYRENILFILSNMGFHGMLQTR